MEEDGYEMGGMGEERLDWGGGGLGDVGCVVNGFGLVRGVYLCKKIYIRIYLIMLRKLRLTPLSQP